MRKQPAFPRWQKLALLGCGAVFALFGFTVLSGIAGMNGRLYDAAFYASLVLFPPALLTGSLILASRARLLTPKDENPKLHPAARLTAALIVISLALALWFSIQSLWIAPFDVVRDKFVAENIATGAVLTGAILTLILSTLQRDIYWLTKRKPGLLDERQMGDRREVFETSYKFGTLAAAITIWGYLSNLDSIERIKQISVSLETIPGHYYIPAYCLVITLFALPLIVAAWRNR
jgi:hypothetical protein